MNGEVGIILEGGAMRGIFTAGIMDYFLDNNIEIKNILAVSAGAYSGMNYVSGQYRRILDSVIEPMRKEKMLGVSLLFKNGEFFNMEALFNRIPRYDSPFDFESFKNSGKRFITSACDCISGEPVYFDKFDDFDEFLHIIRVANSLPLLSKVGKINGRPMMDGGMADAIPVAKAIEEGWNKIIAVVTRDADYRKSSKGDIYNSKLVKFFYHKHKGLLKAIDTRPKRYNDSIEMLNKLEKEGKAFVYRPIGIKLSNNEHNPDVLTKYYQVGYDLAASRHKELIDFLNK